MNVTTLRLLMTGRIDVGRWLSFSAEQVITDCFWFGTPRYEPFFEAAILDATPDA